MKEEKVQRTVKIKQQQRAIDMFLVKASISVEGDCFYRTVRKSKDARLDNQLQMESQNKVQFEQKIKEKDLYQFHVPLAASTGSYSHGNQVKDTAQLLKNTNEYSMSLLGIRICL